MPKKKPNKKLKKSKTPLHLIHKESDHIDKLFINSCQFQEDCSRPPPPKCFEQVNNYNIMCEEIRVNALQSPKSEKIPQISSLLSPEILKKAQQEDPFSKAMIANLVDFVLLPKDLIKDLNLDGPQLRRYRVINGVLEFNYGLTRNLDDSKWRLYIPPSLVKNVLEVCHDHPFAGHFGSKKTKYLIMKHFAWPHMFGDIAEYCKTCETCQKVKYSNKKPQGVFHPQHAQANMEKVYMDIAGPFPRSTKQNKYVLILYDQYSKYSVYLPLSSVKAQHIADTFQKCFLSTMPPPQLIVTDKQTSFTGQVFHDLAKHFAINILFVPTGQHQANAAENRIKKLNEYLRSYIEDFSKVKSQAIWDECLPFFFNAINSISHEVTELPPFKVIFGRDYTSPLDNIFQTHTPSMHSVKTSDLDDREAIFLQVDKNVLKNRDKNLNTIAHRFASKSFKIGDIVKYKLSIPSKAVEKVASKLSKQWSDPQLIIGFVSDNVAVCQNQRNTDEISERHLNDLAFWTISKAEREKLQISHCMVARHPLIFRD
jgi:hypothetical protein